MRQTRLAIVSDAVLPFHKGGKETRSYYLSHGLKESNYDITIFTMHWWPEKDKKITIDGITYQAICSYHNLYKNDRRSIWQAFIFGLSCFKLISSKFDLLEVDQIPYFPLFSTKLICLIKRRSLYATWHEVWGLDYWKQYLGPVTGRLAYVIELLSVMLPDHIIAVSEHTQKKLLTVLHYKGKLSLVANGIDYHQIVSAPVSSKRSDLIYVGRLLSHKNVDLLIEAVAILIQSYPRLQCSIIGDGPEMARLKRLVNKLHLESSIRFYGHVESSIEVMSLMKASKVFVLPSSREGFGISVLEAYACDLKVVTVNCPENAARYLIKNRQGVVTDLSATALADAIDKLLGLKPLQSTAVLKNIKNDWSQRSKSLKKVYVS